MPELPDVEVYLECLRRRAHNAVLEKVIVHSPFLLRTYEPKLDEAFGSKIVAFRRLGKRLVLDLSNDLRLVLHLMIAGRLFWRAPGERFARSTLADFVTDRGCLHLTEAGTKRRAALFVVKSDSGVNALARSGVEPLTCTKQQFIEALRRENHTLKRTLTDPDLFSGIGNAYSDEILHRARLSPTALSQKLGDAEAARLHESTVAVLREWTKRLLDDVGDGWPEKVTAFRPEMAVHGKFGQPCPACGAEVQRIVHADNETNYCARCQTGGKLLADRALSQLLKADWPKTLEELEERRAQR